MALKSAQVGGEIFLQNKYFSIGINSDGGLGTQANAPTSFNSDAASGFLRVGLFADLDGFGTGNTTTLHDAILPGRTIEGFNVGYKIAGTKYVQSNQQLTGFSQIDGDAANASTAAAAAATWKGSTAQKLAVSQKMTLTDDAKYIRIDVTLTNNSAVSMSDVRYMRTADPDQGSTFATENKIVQQGAGGALVASYANGANPFFFYSNDARAKVSTYGFVNSDPFVSTAWDSAQASGYTMKADQTVNITFAVGTLAAGQSTTVTLYMGVTDNLDATLAAINNGAPPIELPNLAPIAAADAVSVVAGQTVNGNVLANDRDPEGSALSATLKTGPANGTLKLNADGTFSYAAKAGFTGTDTFTYSASDGKLSSTAAVSVKVTAPPNTAPVATADSASVVAGQTVTGNVLANDVDAQGTALSATLKTGPAHGTLKLNADGSYAYAANAGWSGTDTFTYAASDGSLSSTATVSVKVSAPVTTPTPTPTPTGDPLLTRAGTIDGSAATSDVLTGASHHNSFFFKIDATSGSDRITNFGPNDVLVTNKALYDGNGDGIIAFSYSKLSLDAPKSGDSVKIDGVSSLRFLGADASGNFVYGEASVKPRGAIEGKLGNSVLKGDTGDLLKQKFFFDTALDINLGNDRIDDFGAKDIIITTSALSGGVVGSKIALTDGIVKLAGGTGGPGDTFAPGEAGTIELHGIGGALVQSIEYDGSVVRDGTTYFVYSLPGSSGGLVDLVF